MAILQPSAMHSAFFVCIRCLSGIQTLTAQRDRSVQDMLIHLLTSRWEPRLRSTRYGEVIHYFETGNEP